MTAASEDPLLLVGRVLRTQGIKGQVKVSSFGEDTESFSQGRKIYIKTSRGEMRSFLIEASRPQRQWRILGLEGVKRIEEAEELLGGLIYVPKESLKALPEEEFYWYQLLGLQVRTEEGILLGTIKRIFPTGSNDVFVVQGKEREILIPATAEVVLQVDLKEGFMTVRPLEGLLEDDAL